MKKILSTLLILLVLTGIILGLLSSCAKDNTPGDETTKQIYNETTAKVAETTDAVSSIPVMDLDGFNLKIIESERAKGTGADMPHGNVDEAGDNVISNALFIRNRLIEEKYHAVITTNVVKSSSVVIENEAASGSDNGYSVIMEIPAYLNNIAIKGYLYNLYDIEYMNLENPWYNQNQIKSFSILDKLYFVMGDFSFSTLFFGGCMLYNNDLGKSLSKGDIYETVASGNWTLDELNKVSEAVSLDLDSDELDRYALVFANSHNLVNFMYSCGETFIKYDKDKEEFIQTYNIEKNQKIVEKLIANIISSKGGTIEKNNYEIFKSGRTLMTAAYVGSCLTLNDMQNDFTPIPYPKFDASQKDYYCMMTANVLTFAIPNTVANPDYTGLLIEAMSAHSDELNEASFDTALSYKAIRTPEAYNMLQIIKDGLIIDFGYLTATGNINDIRWIIGDLVFENSTNVASKFNSLTDSVQTFYNDLLNQYRILD